MSLLQYGLNKETWLEPLENTEYTLEVKGILEQMKSKGEMLSYPFVIMKCDHCGKIYTRRKYEYDKAIRNGAKTTYCSNTCMCRANNENRFEKRFCPTCGEVLHRGDLYCSESCKKIFANKRNMEKREKKKVPCLECGKLYYPISHKSKFCSMDCKNLNHSKRMTGEGNSRFANKDCYRKEFQDMRQTIISKQNHCCDMCGEKELIYLKKNNRGVEVPTTSLEVHHKDSNKQNNSEENLVALCGKCHRNIHQRNALQGLNYQQAKKKYLTFRY